VSRTGIITIYLKLREVVGRGFLDIYPSQTVPSHQQSLGSFCVSLRPQGILESPPSLRISHIVIRQASKVFCNFGSRRGIYK
jgi:hypothetical protein